MGSFLDVVLPPLLLLAFGLFLCGVATVLTVGRLRLWAAQRRRLSLPFAALAERNAALSEAADAFAAVISDPGLSGSTRDRAVTAYSAVSTALTKGDN